MRNPHNPSRKSRGQKGVASFPALDFAIRYDMLSDDEIELCRSGKANIEGSYLYVPEGHFDIRTKLYMGRRHDLMIDQLLNIDPEHD